MNASTSAVPVDPAGREAPTARRARPVRWSQWRLRGTQLAAPVRMPS